MPLADKLAELLGGEGVAVPDGFNDSVMAEYDTDIAAAVASANAESNTIIGLRDERIRELMAQAQIEEIPDEDKKGFDDQPGDNDAEDEDADFDDFFSEDPADDPDNK